MNYQNLNQKDIASLCETKEVTALAIKRYKKRAWIACFNGEKMIGISRRMTEDSADRFYDKMKEAYGV